MPIFEDGTTNTALDYSKIMQNKVHYAIQGHQFWY